ncbi:kinase-like domain-containing protein [Mycena haematopus]|nr:kinase-like domain-containing protein [Mycena haematopus]
MASFVHLQDYDIMEEIASGKTSTVYLVNCKRGRLRNRQLALRKISARSKPTELSDSSLIHVSLSHPSIVSLLSTFSTPLADFQVLELCLGGTLSTYLEGQLLSEGHLRGVLKSLFEALIYLKNQGVVHRNIRPSNVLLMTDGRIKLCDFKLATHLPPTKLPPDCFVDTPHFVAPEILRNSPHTYDADIWSTGCVALTCLSGQLPFEADSTPETVDKILNALYVLPEGISTEAQDLVVKLLEINSIRRIPPHDALSHPFFNVDLPATPLNFSLSNTSDSVLSKHALFESAAPGRTKDLAASLPYGHRKHPRLSYAPKTTVTDVKSPQTALGREISARRIVSDPLPRQRRHVTPEVAPSTSQVSQSRTSQHAVHPLNPQNHKMKNVGTESRVSIDILAVPPSVLPVGTTRPRPFTTELLTPEIHKTVHGQITVLPSYSLLVDLREGERRRGQKGTEVLVINSHGTEIEVYSAPHLSLPCCLVEPTQKYAIEDLPSAYWKQYNDAALLVERIKQRTPRLILHTPRAKCVLMANSPQGDIELLLGSPSPDGQNHGAPPPGDAARMRTRLSRQTGSLEIAKHVSGARGEEWTKKVLKAIDEYPHICATDWDTLDATEQDSMAHLARFWRTCEALEQLEREDHPVSRPYKSSSSGSSKSQTSRTESPNTPLPASFSSTRTLPLMNVTLPPRPPKLASRKTAQRPPSPSIADVANASTEGQYPSVTGKTGILPTWCRDDNDDSELTTAKHHFIHSKTKYIPTVGWCIRQSSRVSQGGRYKIMFFDGTTLEIDVDEDWAELTSPGEGLRGTISGNAMRNDTLRSG